MSDETPDVLGDIRDAIERFRSLPNLDGPERLKRALSEWTPPTRIGNAGSLLRSIMPDDHASEPTPVLGNALARYGLPIITNPIVPPGLVLIGGTRSPRYLITQPERTDVVVIPGDGRRVAPGGEILPPDIWSLRREADRASLETEARADIEKHWPKGERVGSPDG